MQEPGESYDQYRTALRMVADGCDFHTITPDEILRDCLVFGIKDDKVRERLLRESGDRQDMPSDGKYGGPNESCEWHIRDNN